MMLQKILGVNYRVNQPIKRVLVACTQADEFIGLDDLVTRLCFMDNYSVTASVHAAVRLCPTLEIASFIDLTMRLS